MAKDLRPYQKQAIHEVWQTLIKDDQPVLLMASVGAGKSLMIADVLLRMERQNKRALCIVNNAQLVKSNCETYINQGGNASIYCAALKSKDSSAPIVFATPQTLINGINKNDQISTIEFNLIVVDEAHNINYLNHRTYFMRILRHYKVLYNNMRVLGATGTNYRFKGFSIVGEECLFKTQVGNITTEYLIDEGYLVRPHLKVDESLVLDFSKVKVKKNGLFDSKQLGELVDSYSRLTKLICKQIIHVMTEQNRFGIFIFATTTKHAYEIMGHLPPHESRLILGETPEDERTKILDEARKGTVRYLVNISIISVGIDIPSYDTIAYLRPTESLVLLVQTMGRALRLSPQTGKQSALIMDFAGNIDRHSHWDNPILLRALEETLDENKEHPIICPQCMTMNTVTARRCTGVQDKIRCSYYFQFKECENCGNNNDITARHCYSCKAELIDPNDKLSLPHIKEDVREYAVLEGRFAINDTKNGFRVNCMYRTQESVFYESYSPISTKAKNVFYGKFVKQHCKKPSDWYLFLQDKEKMNDMIAEAKAPKSIFVKHLSSEYKITKKVF